MTNKSTNAYSVLMAVYKNDNAAHFKLAAESMLAQTAASDDIVLVCDGPIYGELEEAVNSYEPVFNIIRLPENRGLGAALNEGLRHCRHKLVARMDSDDISLPERCESQLKLFLDNPKLGIASSAVSEFIEDEKHPTSRRVLPETHEQIVLFSRKRNPFNHPAVMFRKSEVIAAGGYTEEYHFFEDYDLWVRMLKNGSQGCNLPQTLLLMRVSDSMYLRRGGKEYARCLLRFHNHLRKTGWISTRTFLTCAVPHAVVCLLPNKLRKWIYGKLLRK